MQLTLSANGKEFKLKVEGDSVVDLERAVSSIVKYNPIRNRLYHSGKVLEKKSLDSYGIKNGDSIVLKDLGPQIGYSTVFFLEYLGPLLIHPLIFFNQELIFQKSLPMTNIQIWTFVAILFHFVKRELETLFVHKFSHDTMPLGNLIKNCTHVYWILSGFMIALTVYRPGFNGGLLGGIDGEPMYFMAGIFAFAQVSNFITHKILSNLRPPGSKIRKIPEGYGFTYVTCPNYYYEIMAWITVTIVSAFIFTLVGAIQMYLWAVKKHKRYLKEFPGKYPKSRKILIPYIL